MSGKILFLFPDTNFFIQCRQFSEIDWKVFHEFDEVHLLLCRPVQREIDKHKNQGNSRLGRRARTASTLIKKLLQTKDTRQVINNFSPKVSLSLSAEIFTQQLSDKLNLTETDDQLVATVYEFCHNNSELDARILTHDTGPMASAHFVNVRCFPIPDNWLLQEPPTEAEKIVVKLQEELLRYKNTEPKFEIKCIDNDGNELHYLNFVHTRYLSLSETELSKLGHILRRAYPIVTDFGPRSAEAREVKAHPLAELIPAISKFTGMEHYMPASERAIKKYNEHLYPDWFKDCEKRFQELHQLLQFKKTDTTFRFSAKNIGNRPSKDSLLTFRANGNFQIKPPSSSGDLRDLEQLSASLSQPPIAPSGKWLDGFQYMTSQMVDSELMSVLAGINQPSIGKGISRDFGLMNMPLKHRKDPNVFYYKDGQSSEPNKTFELVCQQWRHGFETEIFHGEFCFSEEVNKVEGSLEFQIHAENLSTPIIKKIPALITIEDTNIFEIATDLIEQISRL